MDSIRFQKRVFARLHVAVFGRCLATVMTCLFATTAATAAEPWPGRPIKIIVPVTAGGVVDLAARVLAPKLSQELGQSVVVENRPGAEMIIGTGAVAHSAPDGYTWLLATSSSLTNVPLLKRVNYDGPNAFEVVSRIGYVSQAVLVPRSLGVNTLAELVALAKSNPRMLNYAHVGSGSIGQLNTFLFAREAGIDIQPVSYKGGSAILADLLSNRVNLAVLPSATAAPLIKEGKLVALGVVGTGRSTVLPHTPTLQEMHYFSVNLVGWLGIMVPKGTPAPIIRRANAAVTSAQNDPLVRNRLRMMDISVETTSSPDIVSAQVRKEVESMTKLFKAANIQPER
ncbi:tripartite tricarboxylate transporter substrate binding protein (plasmid) [Cupriavidus pinatubonensis]|uniref:tripartite tricarboxylate transporter substrate binding protein n=1 Tax=Cupriavidus pinatubonensis TaxID=248026 RepID=UPI001C7364C3|nr:tripartite tricarboxylate transporter substrate binding protein [Cupriavidus pinatubonensis]QYY34010.1 tripartite tricarboxylate transporter substrate binding protein [Cupriavidus pinatubonensis]